MRAVICARFSGYRFDDLDRLPLDQVIEIYAAAEWLAEQELKAIKGRTGSRG